MYLNNVRLYAKHLRQDLVPSREGFPEAAHQRLLIQGPNGSGKSTFLEVVAKLWSFFGDWIDVGPRRNPPRHHLRDDLAAADMAAIEIRELVPGDRPIWIGMGKISYWVDLKDEHPGAAFAGLLQTKGGGWEIQLPDGDRRTFRQRSMAGSEPQPNIVYFPPEERTVSLGVNGVPRIIDFTPYSWLATYSTAVDLQSLLLTIHARSPDEYKRAIGTINRALDNQRKEIVGFGTEGLVVRGTREYDGEPYEHRVGALSSGEKQMLLLIGFVAATLRDGGIVVIDEPDLHIHIVMVQQLLGSIEAIVRERRAQLIVAAHSEEVWRLFPLNEERVELRPWRRATA